MPKDVRSSLPHHHHNYNRYRFHLHHHHQFHPIVVTLISMYLQAIFLDFNAGFNFSTAGDGDFPFYAPLLMLIIDTLLYFALSVYFDNVIPGKIDKNMLID